MARSTVTENLSKLDVVQRFFSGTGSSYDRVVALSTCGFDSSWKERILAGIPAGATRIVDQACGTGIVTIELARRFPECHVTGVELRDEYLQHAREKAHSLGIKNVDFVLGRAEDVVLEQAQDCIISSYLAKYADLRPLIANAGAMLRPGGRLILHDFTYPTNPIFRSAWQVHFGLLRWVGTRAFPEWRTVFDELPSFLRATRWVSESIALLTENAFCNVRSESLTFGAAAIVTGTKPPVSLR